MIDSNISITGSC